MPCVAAYKHKSLFLQAVTGGFEESCSTIIDGSGALRLQQQCEESQQLKIYSAHMP
jgi:hypothetical protein